MTIAGIRAVLLDLDGTLYIGNDLIPGALDALDHLRARGFVLRFLTNTSTQNHAQLLAKLGALGLPVAAEELISAVDATRLFLQRQALQMREPLRLWTLTADDVKSDFAHFVQDSDKPHYIVLGDIGDRWTLPLLNGIFHAMQQGAELLAVHKNRFWQTPEGLHVDIGLFVHGLEYVTGKRARILGKPSPDFFRTVLANVACSPAACLMVGDDIDSDIGGAQDLGIDGILVRTGKYRPEYVARSPVQARYSLASIADITQLL